MRMEMMKMMEMDGGCSWGSQAPGRGGREEEPPPRAPRRVGGNIRVPGGGHPALLGELCRAGEGSSTGGGGQVAKFGVPLPEPEPPGSPPDGDGKHGMEMR